MLFQTRFVAIKIYLISLNDLSKQLSSCCIFINSLHRRCNNESLYQFTTHGVCCEIDIARAIVPTHSEDYSHLCEACCKTKKNSFELLWRFEALLLRQYIDSLLTTGSVFFIEGTFGIGLIKAVIPHHFTATDFQT